MCVIFRQPGIPMPGYNRLAVGKNRDEIIKLAATGQLGEQPQDILRDPYVFEFLKIPEPFLPSEKELETRLCDHLQSFLLELGNPRHPD